jgi:GNAT superfamily N-acetyltransferase
MTPESTIDSIGHPRTAASAVAPGTVAPPRAQPPSTDALIADASATIRQAAWAEGRAVGVHLVSAGDLRLGLGLPRSLEDPGARLLSGEPRAWFLSAPDAPPDDTILQVLVHVDGRIVGRMNRVPDVLHVGFESIPIAWLSGFEVDPDQRGRGLGTMLTRIAIDADPTIAIGAVGASAMSAPIFDRLGLRRVDATRIAFVRRTYRLIPAHLPAALRRVPTMAAAAAALAAPVADTATWALRRARGLRADIPRTWTVRPVDRLDATILDGADPSTVADGRPRLRGRRDAARLDWLLAHAGADPACRPRCFAVHDASNRPIGGFILRTGRYDRFGRFAYRNLTLTSVKDWVAADGTAETAARIARLAVVTALGESVDAVHLAATDPVLARDLQARGGHRAGSLAVDLRLPGWAHRMLEIGHLDFRPSDGDHIFH